MRGNLDEIIILAKPLLPEIYLFAAKRLFKREPLRSPALPLHNRPCRRDCRPSPAMDISGFLGRHDSPPDILIQPIFTARRLARTRPSTPLAAAGWQPHRGVYSAVNALYPFAGFLASQSFYWLNPARLGDHPPKRNSRSQT